jgi:hypothetical protein
MNRNHGQQLDLFDQDTVSIDQISLDLSNLSTATMADTIVGSGGAGVVPVYSISTGSTDTLSIDWDSLGLQDININTSNTIRVDGPGADVVINGESLVDTLRGIQDRLAILRPNPDLEQRWQQLRDLREEYQRLEQDILEKERAWAALQQTG